MRPEVLDEALQMIRLITDYAGPPYLTDPEALRHEMRRIQGTAKCVIENLQTDSTVRDRLASPVRRPLVRHTAPDGIDGPLSNGRCAACESD